MDAPVRDRRLHDPTTSTQGERAHRPAGADAATCVVSDVGLLALAVLVALLTLTPTGSGWAWGDPGTELRWYLTGLGDPATTAQLVGKLALLAPGAVLAVLRWPALRSADRLVAGSLAGAVGIEALQWLLPLGRVVSPVDAGLNALGAVVAGGATVLALAHRGAGSPPSQRVGAGA